MRSIFISYNEGNPNSKVATVLKSVLNRSLDNRLLRISWFTKTGKVAHLTVWQSPAIFWQTKWQKREPGLFRRLPKHNYYLFTTFCPHRKKTVKSYLNGFPIDEKLLLACQKFSSFVRWIFCSYFGERIWSHFDCFGVDSKLEHVLVLDSFTKICFLWQAFSWLTKWNA